jgi:hypothetical protein
MMIGINESASGHSAKMPVIPSESEGALKSSLITLDRLRDPYFDCEVLHFVQDDSDSATRAVASVVFSGCFGAFNVLCAMR